MRAAIVLLLTVLCGCAHHYPLPTPGAPEQQVFNRAAAGRDVTVTQTDGTELLVVAPELRGDALHWNDAATSRAGELPLSSIRELRFHSSSRGANDGAMTGVATGLLIGAVAFIGVAGNCQGTTCSVSSRLPVFLVVIPTGFLGALIGSAAGSSMRYSIQK
jgi:hypothetical protein